MLDSRRIQELGGKRLYDHGESYIPGLKRRKSEDIPHFLRDCHPCSTPQGDSRSFVLAPVNPPRQLVTKKMVSSNCHVSAVLQGKDGISKATYKLHNVERRSITVLGTEEAKERAKSTLTKRRVNAPRSRKFAHSTIQVAANDFGPDSGDGFSRDLSPISNCHVSAVLQGKDGSSKATYKLHNVERRSINVLGTEEAKERAKATLTKRRANAPRSRKFTHSTIQVAANDFGPDSGDGFFSPVCGEKTTSNSFSPSKCEVVLVVDSDSEQSPHMERIKKFSRSDSYRLVSNEPCKQVGVGTNDLGVKLGISYENCSKERLSGDGHKGMDVMLRKSENFLLAKESNNKSSFSSRLDLDRLKVCKALNMFDDIYAKLFLQCQLKPKSERSNASQIPVDAAVTAKQQLKWFSTNDRVIGDVPGIKVGDQFRFRAQLALIGLHCQYMFGIDHMNKDGKNVAISIVNSGRYANGKALDHHTRKIESPDVFFYSGQGGNPQVSFGTSKEPEDQKLEGDNLALINSMKENIPIRVIRKLPTSQVPNTPVKSGKNQAFSYDGLYVVSDFTQERGPYDKLIFKFKFNRMHGKPEVAKCLVSTLDKCVVDLDISQGKEKKPIRALNTIDKEKPPPFNYVTEMVYSKKLGEVPSCCNCDCINGCSDENPCSCLIKNGGEIPFNERGAILKPKSIVYECGPSCKCPPSCNNRVSQNGVHHDLEIFKTKSKGWGVRSRNFIASGSFVCEYAGELLTEKEAEKRINNDDYLFDIGANSENYVAPAESCHNGSQSTNSKRNDEDGFTIDAAEYGNIGRFINHSCSPNLFAQDVLYDHNEKRRPHVMLFASKNIPPSREFTFDYNYRIGQVRDVNGNVKIKNCYCGAHDCTGRMY